MCKKSVLASPVINLSRDNFLSPPSNHALLAVLDLGGPGVLPLLSVIFIDDSFLAGSAF